MHYFIILNANVYDFITHVHANVYDFMYMYMILLHSYL